MPRYFFHVIDGRALLDKVGTELAGLDEARTQALETATELLRRSAETIWNGCPWQMAVANAAGDRPPLLGSRLRPRGVAIWPACCDGASSPRRPKPPDDKVARPRLTSR